MFIMFFFSCFLDRLLQIDVIFEQFFIFMTCHLNFDSIFEKEMRQILLKERWLTSNSLIFNKPIITSNNQLFGCPFIYMYTIHSAILFIDTSSMLDTTKHIL